MDETTRKNRRPRPPLRKILGVVFAGLAGLITVSGLGEDWYRLIERLPAAPTLDKGELVVIGTFVTASVGCLSIRLTDLILRALNLLVDGTFTIVREWFVHRTEGTVQATGRAVVADPLEYGPSDSTIVTESSLLSAGDERNPQAPNE